MIIKTYEISKVNFEINNFVLFYGQNEGFKKEEIQKIKFKIKTPISNYDEKQILENEELFYNNILSGSLFEDKKIIIINRASDKLIGIIENLIEKKINDRIILVNCGILEKKSKLRKLFEKEKKLICVPFYPDNDQTLVRIAQNFFQNIKIPISSLNLNFIITKCNGDREKLNNELSKIKMFCLNKNKLNSEDLFRLINLDENHSISKLIDNCLAKNKKNIINILNENIFSNEESITIIRIFLNKSKRLLNILKHFENEKDIERVMANIKPPIFWKDKEIVKKQINNWTIEQIKKLIFEINKIELKIKKNSSNSVYFLTNFLLEKSVKS